MTLIVRCVCVCVGECKHSNCKPGVWAQGVHRGCTGGAQGVWQGRPAGPPQPRSLIKLSTGDPWRPSQSTRSTRSISKAPLWICASFTQSLSHLLTQSRMYPFVLAYNHITMYKIFFCRILIFKKNVLELDYRIFLYFSACPSFVMFI